MVRVLSALDALFLALALSQVWNPNDNQRPIFVVALLVVPYWIFLFRYFGIYESHRLERTRAVVRRILSAQLTATVTVGFALTVLHQAARLRELMIFVGVGTAALIFSRAAIYVSLHILRRRGYDKRNVCVIGDWESALGTQEQFDLVPESGLQVTCVGIGKPQERSYVSFGDRSPIAASLEELLRKHVIDEVLIAVAPEDLPDERPTVQLCSAHGVIGRVFLKASTPELSNSQVEIFGGETTLTVGRVPGDHPAAGLKRGMDVVLGAILLLLASPILLVAALLVKLSSPGAVIFKQRRAGMHGRPFVMYKFRTMVDGADSMLQMVAHRSITGGPVFKDRNDTRITPIGRLLRRFSIDELPQLFNVVKGDMSLVGPRPLPLAEAERIMGVHRRRFSMRPGITCVWQVNGRSDTDFVKWMSYDLEYIDGWSLWLDTKLLVQTIPAVLSGKGAY